MFPPLVSPSILSTNHSAVTPVKTVTVANKMTVAWILSFGIVSSSSVDVDEIEDDEDDEEPLW